VLIGAALGTGTALAGSSESAGGGYYKATRVLFLEEPSSGQSSAAFGNLEQDALLATSGDVPKRIGDKLGEDGRQIAEQVITTPNTTTNTIEITAAASTARESEELANTFAERTSRQPQGQGASPLRNRT